MYDAIEHLAELLEPFTVSMNATVIVDRKRLVEALAADEDLDARELVTASCALADSDAWESLVKAIRRSDASVVVAGREDLASTLASVALILRLQDSSRSDVGMLALLVESARFVGLQPALPAVFTVAVEVKQQVAKRSRMRLEPQDTAREVRSLISSAGNPIDGSGVPDSAQLTKAIRDRDAALRAVARRVEAFVGLVEDRFELLEEELDLLWWSRRGQPQGSDKRWRDLPPASRAALASQELHRLLVRAPAPSSARSLLAGAVVTDTDDEVTVAEVAAFLDVDRAALRDRFAPLHTCAAIIQDVGEDDPESVARIFDKFAAPMQAQDRFGTLEVSEQVLRELQILEMR